MLNKEIEDLIKTLELDSYDVNVSTEIKRTISDLEQNNEISEDINHLLIDLRDALDRRRYLDETGQKCLQSIKKMLS